jgi:hypothetical protein
VRGGDSSAELPHGNVYNAGGSRPPPAAGAPSTGETPFNNRLPTRSPGITSQRPRSADVDSDWPLGDGRQDPAADSGRVRAQHRPGPIIIEHHTTNGAVVWAHRNAHHDNEAYRSPAKHRPPEAYTVRAALDSQLLTNQAWCEPP